MVAANHPRSSTRSHTPISVSTIKLAILLTTAFIFGLAICSAFFLWQTHQNDPVLSTSHLPHYHGVNAPLSSSLLKGQSADNASLKQYNGDASSSSSTSILDGLRVLVTIASYDFMQLSHLEEVLDGFQDLCYAGSKVDIVVHTTVLVSVFQYMHYVRSFFFVLYHCCNGISLSCCTVFNII